MGFCKKRSYVLLKNILIGVDGGGTKTNLVAVEATSGSVVATATSGSIHTLSLGYETACKNLAQGVQKLALSPQDAILGIALGDPAIDDTPATEKDGLPLRRFGQSFCVKQGTCFAKSDVFMALYAFTGGAPGAFLVAGTGSMGVAITKPYHHAGENPVLTVGGWGDPTCDPGSGCYIAVEAIKASLNAFDGVGPDTGLCKALLDFYGVRAPRELIDRFNGENATRSDWAVFARQVDDVAMAGDRVAQAILKNAGEVLAAYANRMLKEMEHPQIGIYGSILLKCQTVNRIFTQKVLEMHPTAKIQIPQHPPEYGAAMFAADALGIDRRNWI